MKVVLFDCLGGLAASFWFPSRFAAQLLNKLLLLSAVECGISCAMEDLLLLDLASAGTASIFSINRLWFLEAVVLSILLLLLQLLLHHHGGGSVGMQAGASDEDDSVLVIQDVIILTWLLLHIFRHQINACATTRHRWQALIWCALLSVLMTVWLLLMTVLDNHFSLFLGVVCILYGYVVDKMLLLYTLVVLSKCYSFFF